MLGRIFNQTFSIVFRSPSLFLLAAVSLAIAYIGSQLIQPYTLESMSDSASKFSEDLGYSLGILAIVTLYHVVTTTISGFLFLASIKLASAASRSERLSLRQALSEAFGLRRQLLQYIVFESLIGISASMLFGMLMLNSFNLAVTNAALNGTLTSLTVIFAASRFINPLSIVVVMLSSLFQLWWTIAIALVHPVIAFERIGGVQAVRRSWNLTRRTWYVLFAPIIFLAVFGCVGVSLIALLSIVTAVPLNTIVVSDTILIIGFYAVFFILYPFATVYMTVWYLEAVKRQAERSAELLVELPAA